MSATELRRLKDMNKYFKELPAEEQEKFLTEIRWKSILEKAKSLDHSVKKNNLSLEEIVEEVRVSRLKKRIR